MTTAPDASGPPRLGGLLGLLRKRKPDELPSLALGAMNFGKRTAEAESARIVRRALERGIRVFDTANAYNAGESERILGRALGTQRNDVLVTTKAGIGLVLGKPEGLSPEVMRKALAASLERMGTGWTDVYYLHLPDRRTPIEESLRTMQELIASGRVRAWGVSNYSSWEMLEMIHVADAIGLARPIVAQALYNALHRQLDVEYFAFARRYAVHTTAYNALAGGLLTGRHHFEEAPEKGTRFEANKMYRGRYWTRTMFDRQAALAKVAEAEGCSLVELAYAWLASRADVDSILVGAADVAQLDAAIEAVGRVLSPEARAQIDALWREWLGTDTNYVR
jgi:aryl-alcohol dehydrogenase-like predicted oxidoreductase